MNASVAAHATAESERFLRLIMKAAELWAAKHDTKAISLALEVDEGWVANNLFRIRLEAADIRPASLVVTFMTPPPSANQLFVRLPRRVVKSKHYASWSKTAAWELRSQTSRKFTGQVAVLIILPRKVRGDADNRIKATLDALQAAEIVKNDSQCCPVKIDRGDVAVTTITITPEGEA
jgi:Holliday junction resolvase RusA-like endonuclease